MPIVLFILNTFLKIVTVLGILKLLEWIFGNDYYTEDTEQISWFTAAIKRPSLLIRPFLILVLTPVGLYIITDYVIHSPSDTAAHLRNFCILAWPFLKWFFIIASVAGINWIIWWQYFDTSTDDSGDRYAWVLGWFPLLRLGKRNPIIGLNILILVNVFFIAAICDQLPEPMRHEVSTWIVLHLPSTDVPESTNRSHR